jgi:lipopolysaccharide biosynthesis protein
MTVAGVLMIRKILRLFWIWLRGTVNVAAMGLSRGRAAIRFRTNMVRQTYAGDIDLEQATKIAIFAHWDSTGQIYRYVQYQLQSLRDAGYTTVFVSNSPILDESSINILKPLVGRVIWRHNIGYDFGAYKDAIASLGDLRRLHSLIIANDSTYGPFSSLSDLIERADVSGADVYAITDSWELRYHLQSYFMLFHVEVLQNKAFNEFWQNLTYVNNKQYVVRVYEVGLTKLLLDSRLRLKALFPYDDLARLVVNQLNLVDTASEAFKRLPKAEQEMYFVLQNSLSSGTPMNGSHFFWDKLLLDMRCPYIKRELLAVNPMRIPGLIYWREHLASVSDYDPEMIREHLQVIG